MARAARSYWSGAIQFGGFPIHLKAYNLIQSRSAKSFKSLCSCHQQPITMPKRCPVDERPLDSSELLKGHEVSKGKYVPLAPEAVEQLSAAEATHELEIAGLPLRESVPMGLATQHFRLVPNDDVPGAEQPAQILWNGLRASGRVVVTEWVPKAGSRDSLVVIEADEFGLTGHALPYASELKDAPEFQPVENEKAQASFEQFAAISGISMDEFHLADYESQYEARRAAAIEAAIKGEPIEVSEAPAKGAAAPDLMAMMEGALAEAKAAKPAKTKAGKAPAKPKAKVS